jgi:hypothetical protein
VAVHMTKLVIDMWISLDGFVRGRMTTRITPEIPRRNGRGQFSAKEHR